MTVRAMTNASSPGIGTPEKGLKLIQNLTCRLFFFLEDRHCCTVDRKLYCDYSEFRDGDLVYFVGLDVLLSLCTLLLDLLCTLLFNSKMEEI